ncbi:MAG: BNR/Asp-box repeat protein [Ignavibacteria bacterium]|nr:BNR/Asp-box repeat protein [Ignavibacteria bacterium]
MKKALLLLFVIFSSFYQSQAQKWESLFDCLGRGDVRVFETSGDTIFTGCYGKGIYYSTDSGIFWLPSNNGILDKRITSILRYGNIILTGTEGGGIYKSTDNGKNWSSSNQGLENLLIYSLLDVNDYFFAGTVKGLYISTNKGSNWIKYNFQNTPGDPVIHNLIKKDNFVYAYYAYSDVFYSSDYGARWEKLDNFRSCYGIYFDGNKTFLYGEQIDKQERSLYISTNNGISWQKKGLGLIGDATEFCSIDNIIFAGCRQGYTSCVFSSSDHGDKWKLLSCFSAFTQTALSFKGDIYFGSGLGINKSTNMGVNWNNVSVMNISSILNYNSLIFAGTNGNGLLKSNDGGKNWINLNTKSSTFYSDFISGIANSSNIIFISTFDKGIFKSTDGGINFLDANSGLNFKKINDISVSQGAVFANSDSGIFFSIDNGNSWNKYNSNNYQANLKNALIDGGILYKSIPNNQILYKSSDFGRTWNENKLKFYPEFILKKDTVIYLCSNSGIATSSNNGMTWNDLQMQGFPVSINFFVNWHGLFFISSKSGVYYSVDDCQTWLPICPDSNKIIANTLSFTDDYIFAGSSEGGIYRMSINNVINPLNIEGLKKVCTGDTVTYYSFDKNFTLANWTANTGKILKTTDTTLVIKWEESGTVKITVTKTNFVNGIKGIGTIFVEVILRPSKPTITRNVLTLISSSPTGNQWYNNGKFIPNANGNILNITSSGLYSVNVTNKGCTSEMSDIITNVEEPGTLIQELEISPNPADNILYINSYQMADAIRIFTIEGIKAMELPFNNEIDISLLPEGMYFVQVGSIVRKFVKVK